MGRRRYLISGDVGNTRMADLEFLANQGAENSRRMRANHLACALIVGYHSQMDGAATVYSLTTAAVLIEW